MIKTFALRKTLLKRTKSQATHWKKIFANHIFHKKLVSTICKECSWNRSPRALCWEKKRQSQKFTVWFHLYTLSKWQNYNDRKYISGYYELELKDKCD